MNNKSTFTLVIETNGTDESNWIFRSYSRHLVNPHEAERYGLTIIGIEEGHKLAELHDAKNDINRLQEKVWELEGQIASLEHRLYDNSTKA